MVDQDMLNEVKRGIRYDGARSRRSGGSYEDNPHAYKTEAWRIWATAWNNEDFDIAMGLNKAVELEVA